MTALEILLELVKIEEESERQASERASKLRSLYTRAANAQSQPISHHVGGDVHQHPQERPQAQSSSFEQDEFPPAGEVCNCDLPVDRRSGNYKKGRNTGKPYVMSHCPKPVTQSCGYKKWYKPLPVRDHSNDWQPQNEPDWAR